jgi:hypothetical protein
MVILLGIPGRTQSPRSNQADVLAEGIVDTIALPPASGVAAAPGMEMVTRR